MYLRVLEICRTKYLFLTWTFADSAKNLIPFFFFFNNFLSLFVLREGERTSQGRTEREREAIPTRLHTVKHRADVGSNPRTVSS